MWKRLKNKKLQQRLNARARIIQLIREFFIKQGFLEVETPILVPFAGQEPYLNPMKVVFNSTHPPLNLRGGERRGYLITSPEYSHKKLLAAGFQKTFEITKCFRDGEPAGGLHNPEFTMLEWYRSGADYTKIMSDVEKMIQYVYLSVIASGAKQSRRSPRSLRSLAMTILYQDHSINLSSPWERITVREAFEKYAGISVHAKVHDRELLRGLSVARGYAVSKTDTYEDLFFKIFLTEIEPKLGFPKPTILYEYPSRMAALARLRPPLNLPLTPTPLPQGEGRVRDKGEKEGVIAERFELYIAGIELANAFSELNDTKEQRQRFLQEQKLRRKLGKEIIPIDQDFLDALAHMPPAAGIALGIDRLVMLMTDAPRIEDVIALPARDIFK